MKVRFTKHAREVMARRCVSPTDVLCTIASYSNRYHSPSHQGKPTAYAYVYQKDALSVVVDERDKEVFKVVTVLLNSSQRWTDQDVRSLPHT